MMTPAMRADLAGREQDIQRGKTVELLRRAGKEMYDNPIVNTAIGFTPVLGDVQAAGETMAALNRGAPWQETAGYAAGMLPFIPMVGKTVWHGSPHTFEKFDLSKIGTGEGAQAYGHGLYFADAPEVSQTYMRTQLNNAPELEKMALKAGVSPDAANTLAQWYHNTKDKSKLADFMETMRAEAPNPYIQKFRESVLAEEPAINKAWESFNAPGSLYKVDLPDEQIAKMLDWDKPLSEQPKNVQEALAKFDPDMYHVEGGDYDSTELGQMVYSRMSQNPAEASQRMYQAGIPGIQYLDQASRGAGEGTRNYVVFSDEIPQILERNGQPVAQALRDYRGSHTAPGPDFGAPLHDLTGGGQMYPEDVYSRNAVQYYGTGDTKLDKESFALAQRMRNKPEEMIDIYRAVPNEGNITSINAGDWVTINPNYAKQHGESNLPEGYKILQQKVPAKTVWTNADSIHEYGYWPE